MSHIVFVVLSNAFDANLNGFLRVAFSELALDEASSAARASVVEAGELVPIVLDGFFVFLVVNDGFYFLSGPYKWPVNVLLFSCLTNRPGAQSNIEKIYQNAFQIIGVPFTHVVHLFVKAQ